MDRDTQHCDETPKLTNYETLRPETSDWLKLICVLCNLRDALGLLDDYDEGHPIFMALDRTAPGMSKEDVQFAENVAGFYAEQLAVERYFAEAVLGS